MSPSMNLARAGLADVARAPCPAGANAVPAAPCAAAALALTFSQPGVALPALVRAMPAHNPPGPASGLPNELLQGVIDALDIGVLVCDERGRLLLANAAARRELDTGGVLQLTPEGALNVCRGTGLLVLRRAVHAASLARSYQLVPLRSGDRQLLVSVQPVQAAEGAAPCALLLLGRRRLCPDLAVQELGRLYALTAAERDVLASLLAGISVAVLARGRGVAVSTVRTQVAALRAKFGVRRIDDITRLVAELPPMLGALPGLGAALAAGGTGGARAAVDAGSAGGAAGTGALHR
ncbi:MAG: helix-turn-helix transcriptional regulator [Microbacteriaceae bacterium]|nr:helix-turn-helix transcriptional regulator [Burkholderiaceae bacterium]